MPQRRRDAPVQAPMSKTTPPCAASFLTSLTKRQSPHRRTAARRSRRHPRPASPLAVTPVGLPLMTTAAPRSLRRTFPRPIVAAVLSTSAVPPRTVFSCPPLRLPCPPSASLTLPMAALFLFVSRFMSSFLPTARGRALFFLCVSYSTL